MRVKVGMVPGKIHSIILDEGTTVADAIRIAGFDPTGYELRVNSTVTENFNLPLSDGAQVLLAKKVKGNGSYFSVFVKQEGVMIDVEPEEFIAESENSRVSDILKLAEIEADTVAAIFVNGKKSNTGSYVGKDAIVTYKTKEQVETEEKATAEAKAAAEVKVVEDAPAPEPEKACDTETIDVSGLKGRIIIKTKSGEFVLNQ